MYIIGKWKIPPEGLIYAPYFSDAESKLALPAGILSRMAWQESRFRPDIISGETASSAGAQGLMQIVPRWHPNANPLDPIDSIYYAGQYLKDMYDRFGTWKLALAAYNWGPGSLNKALKAKDTTGTLSLPDETQNYVDQITGDLWSV